MNTFALLVPCYNAENYITQFLDSVNALNKTFDEVIFYDDASTDNTVSILKGHGQNVIEGEINRGPAFARNMLAKATGCSWFHFHDIDDLLAKDYLQKTSEKAATGKYDVVLCNVDWVDESKNNIVLTWHYSNLRIQENPILYTLTNPIGGINGLYRKTVFDGINGFNEELQMWEDSDLHVRLSFNQARFCVIEEVLTLSIRYSNSQSTDQKKSWEYRLICLENYKTIVGNNSTYSKAIGRLAENLVGTFLANDNLPFAHKAIALTKRCGIPFPNTDSITWKAIRSLLPDTLVTKLRILHLTLAFK